MKHTTISLLSALAVVSFAKAQTNLYWNPSSGAALNASSWYNGSGQVAPGGSGNTSNLIFDTYIDSITTPNRKATPMTMSYGGSVGLTSLTFNNNFNAANTVSITNGTTSNYILYFAAGWSINNNASSGAVTINKTNNGTLTLRLNGAGDIHAATGSKIILEPNAIINEGSTLGAINKTGGGNLSISGANTYTGGTTISGGTLTANSTDALGVSGNVTFKGGKLQYGAGVSTDYSSRIKSSTSAIAIDTNNQNVTYASALGSNNTGGLTKSGNGTLTLSAANAYSGNTTVSAGTLTASHANALGSGLAEVQSGGTLEINNVTLANTLKLSGGTLSGAGINSAFAGDFSGSGSISGPLTLTAASTYNWELTDSLTLASGSQLILDQNFKLSLTNLSVGSFNTGINQSWTVVHGSAGTITGSALNLDGIHSSFSSLGVFGYTISTAGISLNWTAVPEPSTYAILLGCAALVGSAIHRRKKRSSSLTPGI